MPALGYPRGPAVTPLATAAVPHNLFAMSDGRRTHRPDALDLVVELHRAVSVSSDLTRSRLSANSIAVGGKRLV